MIKSYGKYRVNIASDGAIHVKKDDWISKYSAAIHRGDTSKIHEYGRLRGKILTPLQDPNKIATGERIYHIPTYVLKKLEQPLRKITEIIIKGIQLQREIDVLKKSKTKDEKEIERLDKKIEELEQNMDDAADECSDFYSCMGGGGASIVFSLKRAAVEKQANAIRKRVKSMSRTLEDLENRLKRNLAQQKELRKTVEDLKGMLSH